MKAGGAGWVRVERRVRRNGFEEKCAYMEVDIEMKIASLVELHLNHYGPCGHFIGET